MQVFKQGNKLGQLMWLPVIMAAVLAAVWFAAKGNTTAVHADEPLIVYVSSSSAAVLPNGLAVADEDILALDANTGTWSLFFDGSEFGLKSQDINALEILDDGSLLLSFDQTNSVVPGLGTIKDSDIVKFTPDTPGNYSSGAFTLYMDGSDIGLTTLGEDIDALAIADNGDLLISTFGTAKVKDANGQVLKAADKDLLRLHLTQIGDVTAGVWSLYFDGSDVALTQTSEDIDGAWYDTANGDLLLSTLGRVVVNGLRGTKADIFTPARHLYPVQTRPVHLARMYSGQGQLRI
ncbi:MAG: hypothetical protein R3C44_01405 [Chloroflexota bacterium]